jgi:hypothetical protein
MGIHPCQACGVLGPQEPELEAIAALEPAEAFARWARGDFPVLARRCLDWISMLCLNPSLWNARSPWVESRLRHWQANGADPAAVLDSMRRLRVAIAGQTGRAVERALLSRLDPDGFTAVFTTLPGPEPLDLTAPLEIDLPVRLPAMLRSRPAQIAGLGELAVRAVSGGILLGAEPGESAFAATLQHALSAADAAEVTLESAVPLDDAHASRMLQAAQLFAPNPEERSDLALQCPLPAAALRQWLHLPAERSWDHFAQASRLSAALQQSLRRWLPAAVLTGPDAYSAVPVAAALMAYRASRVFRSKGRDAYTYDPLDARHVAAFCRTSEPGLTAALTELKRTLRASGRGDLAERYLDKNVKRHIRPASGRLPRAIAAILATEGMMIEELLRVAAVFVQSLGGRTGAQRREHRLGSDLAKPLEAGLKRILRGHDLSWLAPLVLADLTRALASGHAPRVLLLARTPEGVSRTCLSTPSLAGR